VQKPNKNVTRKRDKKRKHRLWSMMMRESPGNVACRQASKENSNPLLERKQNTAQEDTNDTPPHKHQTEKPVIEGTAARQRYDHLTLLLISSLTLTTAVPRFEEVVLCCHDPVLLVGLPGDSLKMYSPST
jgi:hypothetical protein